VGHLPFTHPHGSDLFDQRRCTTALRRDARDEDWARRGVDAGEFLPRGSYQISKRRAPSLARHEVRFAQHRNSSQRFEVHTRRIHSRLLESLTIKWDPFSDPGEGLA
jgi:hypothetical protein